jgi:hypothetical protein
MKPVAEPACPMTIGFDELVDDEADDDEEDDVEEDPPPLDPQPAAPSATTAATPAAQHLSPVDKGASLSRAVTWR